MGDQQDVSFALPCCRYCCEWEERCALFETYRDAISVLLADAVCFCLALLEGVLVLELGTHGDGGVGIRYCSWLSSGS